VAFVDREGRSALHYAAFKDDVHEAGRLLAEGNDPNVADRAGLTPLHLAAQEGAVAVARLLLDYDADVDAVNVDGNTPLFVAVFNSRGRGDLIALLRERGADPLRANNSGQTPVGLARLISNYEVARFFSGLPR
jgi:uncharacterized protein